MADQNIRISPLSIRTIREARSISLDQAARETEIDLKQLEEIESGLISPSRASLKTLAKYFAVPLYFFYVKNLDFPKTSLPDFRSPTSKPAKLRASLGASVEQANEIRDVISEGWEFVKTPARGWKKIPRFTSDATITDAAESLRKFFSLDEKPASSFETSKQYMDWLRANAELSGLITIFANFDQDDGRGYCIAHDNKIPYVVLNTQNQIQESRIFTLIHEFVHVALRSSGVSDPFATRNSIERFCNRVTASTLMPRRQFLNAADQFSNLKSDNRFVISVAELFKVSQQAAALRSEETGARAKGFYQRWLSQFTKKTDEQINYTGFPKLIRISRDEGKKKIAKYGTTLPLIFHELCERRFITSLDIQRLSGIKPKYLDVTQKAANQRLGELGLNAS